VSPNTLPTSSFHTLVFFINSCKEEDPRRRRLGRRRGKTEITGKGLLVGLEEVKVEENVEVEEVEVEDVEVEEGAGRTVMSGATSI